MRLRETWKDDGTGKAVCVWCFRDADSCYQDRCNGRRGWEREYRIEDDEPNDFARVIGVLLAVVMATTVIAWAALAIAHAP